MPDSISSRCIACHQTSNNTQGPLQLTSTGLFHLDCLGQTQVSVQSIHAQTALPPMNQFGGGAIPGRLTVISDSSSEMIDTTAHSAQQPAQHMSALQYLMAAVSQAAVHLASYAIPQAPSNTPSNTTLNAGLAASLNTALIGASTPATAIRIPVVTRHGQEVFDLIKRLRITPRKPLEIVYYGEKGFDVGGLSRQAFSKAFTQITDPRYGIFERDSNGKLRLDSGIYPNALKNHEKWTFRDIGLLMGRIHASDVAVGHDLQQEVLFNIYVALHARLPESIESLLNSGSPKESYTDFLMKLQPELYAQEPNKTYINEMSHDDLKDLVSSYVPYFEIAEGMKDTGVKTPKSFDSFYAAICGPTDLRLSLARNLVLSHEVSLIHLKTRENYLAQLKHMIENEPSDVKLKNFCFALTGSYYPPATPNNFSLLVSRAGETEPVAFHSCTRQIDINLGALSEICPEDASPEDQYSLLKSLIFDEKDEKTTHLNMF